MFTELACLIGQLEHAVVTHRGRTTITRYDLELLWKVLEHITPELDPTTVEAELEGKD